MGLFNKFVDAMKSYDYESEFEKKTDAIERRGREQIRQKARRASDEELRHNLERAIDNDNYIMEDEIRREMERRGMY